MALLGYNGGLRGKPRIPSTSNASGIWDLDEQKIAASAGIWPSAGGDPYWANVSLLLHMDGSDGSTTFVDSSSYSHPSTSNEVVISTTQSKFGGSSAYIPTALSYIQFNSDSSLQLGNADYTLEGFIFSTTGSGGGIVISKGDPYASSEFALMRYDANNLRYYPTNSGGTTFTGPDVGQSNLSPDTWYYFAICRSGNEYRFYLDGILQTTITNTTTTITSDPLLIGYSQWFFSGQGAPAGVYIDELRITKGVARYTANFAPPTSPFPNS